MPKRYAELQCKTNFSFLHGASHPDELINRAAELGYQALAITDRATLAGIVRAHVAAKHTGLKLIIGAEIEPVDAPPVILYAPDFAAYRRLARLITTGRRAAPKGECRLTLDDVAAQAQGLVAAVKMVDTLRESAEEAASEKKDYQMRRASVASVVSDQNASLATLARRPWYPSRSPSPLSVYRDIFSRRCYLAAALHRGPDDDALLERLIALSSQTRLPLLAVNDVHYHHPSRQPLHEVLTAVREGVAVKDLGFLRFPNAERYLKSPAQMWEVFRDYPRAITNILELIEQFNFSLEELRYEYPEELSPPGQTPLDYLTELTWQGAERMYPAGIPDKVRNLLNKELDLIGELRYEAFFLTVWDLVVFARARGILCQGRGSAANSAVCFCLGVTSVDPDRHDVLFERFISRERNEAPDIDVDFEHERREEVMQYIYQKYGRDRAGIAAEVITYRPRSAIRDVGKALGLSLDCVDRLAKTMSHYHDEANFEGRLRDSGLDPQAATTRHLLRLVRELLGFPRHLSQHVGGFVITRGPLCELVPIENAAMADRTVIEWDKDDLDALGILKVDCLSLGMLTAIRKSFEFLQRDYGRDIDLATVPAEDPAVYDMICKADTVGVFQIESRAQMSMLPRLRPRQFYDLVIEVAIVRPGPIQGGMVHPFLKRRNGEEPIDYPDERVKAVLSNTLGVPLFQEQVMRLAMVTAGFTAGEADQLRRAMASWGKAGHIDPFREKLRAGMLAHGLPAAFAEQIFEMIRGFGQYGFPESHAASFALLAYVSAWLKCHYPAAFAAALLNSQPMGFYAPAQIVRDAQHHGVTVLPVDVNYSDWDCTLEEVGAHAIDSPDATRKRRIGMRLGLRMVHGLQETVARAIVAERRAAPFRSVFQLSRRAQVSRPILARLAAADAFSSLGLSRREALWQVLSISEALPLFAAVEEQEETLPALSEIPLPKHVEMDYDTVGLSLKAHPIGLLRDELNALKVITAKELLKAEDKQIVRIAGLVLVRQQPGTAKGTVFFTLEDETGTMNLVLWPAIWKRFRPVAFGAVAILVEGRVEHASNVTHVFPLKMEDLTATLGGMRAVSRDFH